VAELDGRDRPGQLYALHEDPGELRDLRHSEPAHFARLERELRARTGDAAPSDDRVEHLEALRDLGYVE
jgi:hypothetical protein